MKEQKTEPTDLKQVLMTNPYRKSREISYLAFEKVLNKESTVGALFFFLQHHKKKFMMPVSRKK